ncbi:MAG TPA: 23S rRNA (uracil(1939)-C(5))-methyltransferase RlmD [Gemmatimonadota bacterium]|jgi:23S rRNA (uracil1939-C5)-methyltransferase
MRDKDVNAAAAGAVPAVQSSGARAGDEASVRIASLAFGGDAVARLPEGRVVFVRGALPGELARVRLTRVRKGHAEAETLEVLEPAPERVAPRCRHFGVCGGCRHQDLAYAAQLAWKTRQVAETLERLGGLRGMEVQPAAGMSDPWHYRNKMEFGITSAGGRPVVGLRERGSFDRIFDLEECPIFSPGTGALVAAVEAYGAERGYAAYDPRLQSGFLRHLVVRVSKNAPDFLVALVTSRGELDRDSLVEAVLRAAPATSLWHVISDSRSNVVEFGEARLLHGSERMAEILPPLRFEFGPGAFFQTNTRMAEVLYRAVRDAARLTGRERLLDLYCGIGAIALYLAGEAGTVIGLEGSPAAVEDARHNARLNGIANAEFHSGDDRRGFPAYLDRLERGGVDVVLLDPPRGGVHARTIAAVRRLAAPRLLYVSCNPASLARDLALLAGPPGAGYRVGRVQPFDLFPHTPHIETLVELDLAG